MPTVRMREGRKTSKEEVGLLMTKLREPQQKGGIA